MNNSKNKFLSKPILREKVSIKKNVCLNNLNEFPSLIDDKISNNTIYPNEQILEPIIKPLNYKDLVILNKKDIVNDNNLVKPGWVNLKYENIHIGENKYIRTIIEEYGPSIYIADQDNEKHKLELNNKDIDDWIQNRKERLEMSFEYEYIWNDREKREILDGYCSMCEKSYKFTDEIIPIEDEEYETFYEEKINKGKKLISDEF